MYIVKKEHRIKHVKLSLLIYVRIQCGLRECAECKLDFMRPREYKTVSTLNRIESNYCLLLPFSRLILTTALSSQSLLVLLLMKAQRHLASGHSVPSTNIHTRTHMSTRTECIYVLLSFEIIVHASVSETLIQ